MEKTSQKLARFANGSVAAIYDSAERENEADLVFLAATATPSRIRLLRHDAGGLICVAMGGQEAKGIGLKFAAKILSDAGYGKMACKRAPYGDFPSFALWVNHESARTGITDAERARTCRELGKLAARPGRKAFQKSFRAPGHVATLISRGLENRKGHTELACTLAKIAGKPQAVALCEMLQGDGRRSERSAKAFCKKRRIPMFSTGEILGEYERWKQKKSG